MDKGIIPRAIWVADRIITFLRDVRCPPEDFAAPEDVLVQAYLACLGRQAVLKANIYALSRLTSGAAGLSRYTMQQLSAICSAAIDTSEPIVDEWLQVGGSDHEDPYQLLAEKTGVLSDLVYRVYGAAGRRRENEVAAKAHAELTRRIGAAKAEVMQEVAITLQKHAATLQRKRAQLRIADDYGIVDEEKWLREVDYFIKRVLMPSILRHEDSADLLRLAGAEMLVLITNEIEEIASQQANGVGDVDGLAPTEFEQYCVEILSRCGWDARLTKASGDQGVDVVARKGGVALVMQCKKYASPVGNAAVQEIHAGKGFLNADVGIVVSNADFTKSARELANALGIALLHYSELGGIDSLAERLMRRA